MNPLGISLEIGRSDKGWFWYLGKLKLLKVRPSLDGIDAKHGGFKIDLMIGKLRRPIPRFYHWRFLNPNILLNKIPLIGKYFKPISYVKHETEFNPWNSGNHWEILTIPIMLGAFLSVCYGAGERQPGFYVGMKTYMVNRISQNRKIYMPDRNDIIGDDIAWGSESEKGNVYLCPSASIRDDLVD